MGYGLSTILIENIPVTVFMIIMADPIVRTVYMWRSFTAADVPITALCLVFYSIGIFAWAGQAIVSRGFFAVQDTVSPVLIGTVTTIIFIPLNFIFIKLLGCGGLALATTTGIIIHFFILTLWLRRKIGGIDGSKILHTVRRVLAATCVLAVVCFGVRYAGYALLGTWKLVDGDIREPQKLAVFLSGTDRLEYRSVKAFVSADVRLTARKYTLYQSFKREVDAGLCDCINSLMKRDGFSRGDVYANREYADTIFSDCLREFRPAESAMSRLILGKSASAKTVSSPDGLYTPGDIISTERLLTEIFEGTSAAETAVRSSMSLTLKARAESFMELSGDVKTLPADIMKCLNEYITSKGKASAGQQSLARKGLCRLLPSYVKSRPFLRIEGNITSGVTVLAALIVCMGVYYLTLKRLGVGEIDEIIRNVTGLLRRKKAARTADGETGDSSGSGEGSRS